MTDTDFLPWMTDIQQRVETALAASLPAGPHAATLLFDAMRYAALDGGKRVRPLLVFAAGDVSGATPEALSAAACAVECIHAYSLVHDDLPCMDDDVLRRGKPTCHIAHGEAMALLAGDALQAHAFELLAAPLPGVVPARQLAMVSALAHAAGPRGMCGGQAIDLAAVGHALDQTALEYMHCLKTGALIQAAVRLGALAGSPGDDELAALDRYARRIGLAFQVIDDVLDCEADSATLGKTAGKDAAHDKPTYVSLMGLGEARSYAHALLADAHEALVPLGSRARRLQQLADYIVARSF